jgi:predicted alpha/beta-hydrolase family hydrolase
VKVTTEQIRLATPGEVVEEVSAVVHRPTRAGAPALLLVHGAGGDLDDPGVVALADAVAEAGHLVVRANLPYREAGSKRRPPRADRSVPGLVALAASARELAPHTPWVVGGKSYGGRVATMAVAEGLDAAGVVLYSYPLHPPGKPDRLRVEHWPSVAVPCLFLQGTRDRFGSPELLDANLRKLPRRATVEIVAGGDHSLRVTGKAADDGVPRAPAVVLGGLGRSVAAWMQQLED